MKKTIVVLSVLLWSFAAFASDEERSTGLSSAKAKMQTALQQIQGKQPDLSAGPYGDTTYKTLSRVKADLSAEYFNKTLMTDYTKSKVMDMLAQLAITSAFSVGTAGQGEQANIIGNAAESLQSSNDPQYRQIGQMFTELVGDIREGNEVEAKSVSAQIEEYVEANAPEISPDYEPTQEENGLLAGLASILSNSMGRIFGMLSTFGIAALFKALGFGALASNPIGLGISIIMQETLGAVFTGVTGGGQVNWQPVEAAAVNQAAGIAEQGAGKVEEHIQDTLNQASGPNTDTVAVEGKTEAGGHSSAPGTK